MACENLEKAREFLNQVETLAKKYDANFFIVTDGVSMIRNKGNPAVRNARLAQEKWERKRKINFVPNKDWIDPE